MRIRVKDRARSSGGQSSRGGDPQRLPVYGERGHRRVLGVCRRSSGSPRACRPVDHTLRRPCDFFDCPSVTASDGWWR